MDVWRIDKWHRRLDASVNRRSGLRLRINSNVDSDVRIACLKFAKWLRLEYEFPLRVPIYIKGSVYLSAKDGEKCVGLFFEPSDYSQEPYITIAAGDYEQRKKTVGRDDALAGILSTIIHELTHYFQWINGLDLTDIGRERQATMYSRRILDEYASTCEHP